MPKKTEFHTIAFFRKVRDQQAAALSGKSPAGIIAFFAEAKTRRPKSNPAQAKASRRRDLRASSR
jgi:hypothetical protein